MCRGYSEGCVSTKWATPEKGLRALDFSSCSAEGRWYSTPVGSEQSSHCKEKLWTNTNNQKMPLTARKITSRAPRKISRQRPARKQRKSGEQPSKRQKSFDMPLKTKLASFVALRKPHGRTPGLRQKPGNPTENRISAKTRQRRSWPRLA